MMIADRSPAGRGRRGGNGMGPRNVRVVSLEASADGSVEDGAVEDGSGVAGFAAGFVASPLRYPSTLTTSGDHAAFLPAISHCEGSVAVFGCSAVAGATWTM